MAHLFDFGVLGAVPLGEGVESNEVRTRGTTVQGEYRSHARMAMIEPNSWDLSEVKVQSSPFYRPLGSIAYKNL